MSLQGNLSDLPFSDLLNIVTRKDKNGILRLSYANNLYRATVLVRDSELYAAWVYEVGTVAVILRYSGEDALHALLVCEEGEFSFELLPPDHNFPARNITSTKREILLANLFQADNFRAPLPVAAGSNIALSPAFNRPVSSPALAEKEASQFSYAGARADLSQTTKKADKPSPKPQRGWISSLITRLRSI
jgi:hypothetical protein